MAGTPDHLPALKAALIEMRAKLVGAEALIEHLQLVIAKMKREMFGPRSERSQRLIDQLELQLEELAAAAGEDEAKAAAARVQVQGFTRRQATRRNFPDDLPRRRIVHPAPTSCPCCGGRKLSKIGEDVTETLDVVPRQWFVTQHVREKFSCRSCETITQPPAPFHAIARGFAGPSLLAMMLVEKYANHQPLNRQSEQYAREGIELSVSTMADHVGACAATLMPLYELIKAHVFAAERIHGDDTTVPVLAKVKTRTGRSAASCRVLLLTGSRRHPSRAASRRIFRDTSGRCLCRVQYALRSGSKARTDHGSRLLGTRETQAIRAC
jgi:transposase